MNKNITLKLKFFLAFLLLFIFAVIIYSQEINDTKPAESSIQVLLRPFASAGYTGSSGPDGHGAGVNAGIQFLIGANRFQRYGIEVSYRSAYAFTNAASGIQFITAGFILEQKFAGWFIMGIGTVGYFGIGPNNTNPFGVVTNLGWEPAWDKAWAPFITFRAEFIFDTHFRQMSSLCCGITFKP